MSTRLIRAIAYGLLTVAGVLGLAALVWAAMPQGAPVTYTASDVVTMPTGTTFTAQILNALGAFTASSSMTAGGTIAYTGDITPPQITTTQDNYNPTGLATAAVLRLSSNAAWSITGLQGGSDGRVLLIENVGSQNFTLAAGPTASTDTNEFDFPADVTMPPKALVLIKYDATSSRWRTISPTLTGAAVRATTLTLAQQTGDPAPPAADDWAIYAKSTGIHIRDDLGNIIGPLGTGGGGGGTAADKVAKASTTGNITLSNPGTAVFDGITLNVGDRLFIPFQTTQTQNGIYLFQGAGASMVTSRTTDADADAEFINNFNVKVQSGTLYGGVTFFLTNTATVSLGTTNILFAVQSWGTKGEVLANKNVNLGYMGLGTTGRAVWTRIGGYTAHTDLAAATTIDLVSLWAASPHISIVGIQNAAAGNLNHTANPHINGCTAGNDGLEVTIVGISPTKTVTIPNTPGANGLLLAGNTGSVIIGQAPGGGSLRVRCNGATTIWEQVGVSSLQQVKNMGAIIGNAVDEASGVITGNTATSTYCVKWGATERCYCAGVACDNIVQLSAGKQFTVMKSDGTTPLLNITDGGVFTPSLGGVVDRSVRVTHNSSQTISAGATDLPIQFDNEVCTGCYDTDNMHNSSTNNSRITFTTGGKYLVMCHGRFAAGTNALSATLLDANIRLNGTTALSGAQRFAPQAPSVYVNPSVQYNFAAGDFIEMVVSFDGSSATSFDVAAGRFPVCSAKQL